MNSKIRSKRQKIETNELDLNARRLCLRCAMLCVVQKHARVVYTREVYKYARGISEIRATRASHETITQ